MLYMIDWLLRGGGGGGGGRLEREKEARACKMCVYVCVYGSVCRCSGAWGIPRSAMHY